MADLRINANTEIKTTVGIRDTQQKADDDIGKVKGGRLFAGGFKNNMTTSEQIEQKREQARKQAYKLIGDAWEKDRKATEGIDELSKMKADKLNEYTEYDKQLADIEKQKSQLMEQYGVDKDSREQKDLELLEKYQDRQSGIFDSSFSKEEVERLKELQNMEMTDYQKDVLRLNGAAGAIKSNQDLLEREMKAITSAITDSESEMAKTKNMVKAQSAADEIISATEDDVFGMLIDEGKKHIDEVAKEEQEKREEIEEEKLKEEEKLAEKNKEKAENAERLEKRKEDRVIINGQSNADKLQMQASLKDKTSNVEMAQKTIQVMVEQSKILEEDLKGIKIDFDF